MDLRSTIERRLKTDPSLSITVKRLSVGERIERNASIEQWNEYRERVIRLGNADTDKAARVLLAQQVEEIEHRFIRPAVIRHGLEGITGLTLDGRQMQTRDEAISALLRHGSGAVLEEVFLQCWEASDLTDEQEKNLLSPGISSTAAMPGEKTTNAAHAGAINSTPGATAAATSPTT